MTGSLRVSRLLTSNEAPERDNRIDRLRGLAVVLMVVDHLLVAATAVMVERPTLMTLGRLTLVDCLRLLTRPSLPLFAVCSGVLLSRRSSTSVRRLAQIGVAAAVSQVMFTPIAGMPDIDVLVVFLAAILMWPLARGHLVETIVLGIVAATNLPPFPHGLTGYSVGLVLAFMAVGAAVARSGPEDALGAARRLPSGFGRLGRRPITAYLIHLFAVRLLLIAVL